MANNYIEFPNIGFWQTQFTKSELEPIWTEVREIQENFLLAQSNNSRLVGHIEHEYRLYKSTEFINKLVLNQFLLYNNQTNFLKNFSVLTSDVPMIIYEPWVNFQKKYEFNPPHRHNGVISFVIWLQIPFFIEAELKNPSIQDSRNPIPGCFNFHYTDALGTIQHYNIQADKTMENTLLLFPSTLNHSVNPFYTSDEYRISVSGNIKLDVN